MQILQAQLVFLIEKINQLIEKQLDLIYETSELKLLKQTWNEIYFLCSYNESSDQKTLIKILNINWAEINKDLSQCADIEICNIFNHLYEKSLGTVGENPFGLFLLQHVITVAKPSHLAILRNIADICSWALAPMVANIDLLDNNESSLTISQKIREFETSSWENLRKLSSSRFLALTAGSGLIYNKKNDVFSNSCLLTLQIINSYSNNHWFSDITKPINISTNKVKITADYFMTHSDEMHLNEKGLISLIQPKTKDIPLFSNIYSIYKASNSNNILLENILCACRFAHHIKIMIRNKIGTYTNEYEAENMINKWLKKYTAIIHDMSMKYQYPLKSFAVKLTKSPAKIGHYNCQILLEPYMSLENISSTIVLQSEIVAPN